VGGARRREEGTRIFEAGAAGALTFTKKKKYPTGARKEVEALTSDAAGLLARFKKKSSEERARKLNREVNQRAQSAIVNWREG